MMASATWQKAPRHVRHPAHPSQALSLVAPEAPGSHASQVSCDACSFRISGYHYNCGSFNLHTYCAGIPPTLHINLPCHPYPPHDFTLRFCPPYPNGQFICNLCGRWGGYHWLYRCDVCHNFDAHLGCAVKAAQHQPQCDKSTTPGYPPDDYGSTPHASLLSSSPTHSDTMEACMLAAARLASFSLTGFPFLDIGSSLLDSLQHLIQV